MWGRLSLGCPYPPLRAKPLKARETEMAEEYIFKKYIYIFCLNRCEKSPSGDNRWAGDKSQTGGQMDGCGQSPDGVGGWIGVGSRPRQAE